MPKKILSGIVVSNKPNKTITVMVERKYQHPLFKKVIKVKKPNFAASPVILAIPTGPDNWEISALPVNNCPININICLQTK